MWMTSMPVSVEMHHIGDPRLQAEVRAVVEHVLADRLGDWRLSIVGSQWNDRCDNRISGLNGFQRSYTLEVTAGEPEPAVVGSIVGQMVPK
jgi:hypothetical protein